MIPHDRYHEKMTQIEKQIHQNMEREAATEKKQ
jgi:hypothetical protein